MLIIMKKNGFVTSRRLSDTPNRHGGIRLTDRGYTRNASLIVLL